MNNLGKAEYQMEKIAMRSITRFCVMIVVLVHLLLATGCGPLAGILSAVSFGAGYLTAVKNPTTTTTTEYYIDGQKVDNPAALGLE
jgi:hypothetical protein